jgi:hypothetical protein
LRVSPEPGAVELLRRYNVALNYAINKILSLNIKTIREVRRELYRELREWFGLLSRIALDCYRDALANAKAWRRNPHRGKRPRVKKLLMLLHPGSGYKIKDGYVEIIGGIRLKIIGWDRRYDQYDNREARLVYREGRMILWIFKRIPRPEQYKPRDVIAIDINERKIVYGDHEINKDIDTAVDRAYRWKLQKEREMIRLAGREARRVASHSKAEWNIVQMLEMLYQGL